LYAVSIGGKSGTSYSSHEFQFEEIFAVGIIRHQKAHVVIWSGEDLIVHRCIYPVDVSVVVYISYPIVYELSLLIDDIDCREEIRGWDLVDLVGRVKIVHIYLLSISSKIKQVGDVQWFIEWWCR